VGSERAFLELDGKTRGQAWQALIPHYAGRPGASGVAAAANAVSVRVTREGPELWVLSTRDATKLGAIELAGYAPGGWDPAGRSGVVTVGDGVLSFEVVDGKTGTGVVAIDLEHGSVLWRSEVKGPISALHLRSPDQIEIVASDGSHVVERRTGRPVP
jgi:outer membrane protein assembly factor BamB